MDITIGFKETPRELVIKSADNRDDLLARVKEALSSGQAVLELNDEKGKAYLINVAEIAHVEVGTGAQRAVGFGGA